MAASSGSAGSPRCGSPTTRVEPKSRSTTSKSGAASTRHAGGRLVLAAPLGTRLAHRLSGPALRRVFAVFLALVGLSIFLAP